MKIFDKCLKPKIEHFGLTKNDATLCVLIINMVFTCILLFKDNSPPLTEVISNNKSTNEIRLLASNITDVQTNLGLLQKEFKKPKGNLDMKQIENGLNKLTVKINQIANENETKIKTFIDKSNAKINSKLGSISQRVESIKNKNSKKYLSVDKLPFSVLSIDNVQEQGVVDVMYSYKNIPLEKGDVLAQWSLKSVDYGLQLAVFENKKHELVKVLLNRGEV